MSSSCEVIADRLFDGKAWTVSIHVRANGMKFYQLTEMAGYRADWPILGHDNTIYYDRPEDIPVKVRRWVENVLKKHKENP